MAKTVRKQKESEKPPLRRPVRGIDNGGQAGLFALDQVSVPSPRRAPDKARFVDDSPQGIFIGRQSLSECLRDSGERDVFVLRGSCASWTGVSSRGPIDPRAARPMPRR